MGPFAGVHSNVPFQKTRPVEYFSTCITGQHCFCSAWRGLIVIVITVVESVYDRANCVPREVDLGLRDL